MHSFRTLLRATFVAVLACSGVAPLHAADTLPIHATAQLRLAGAPTPHLAGSNDPVIYSHVSDAAQLTGDAAYPHLGTAFDDAGAGPQIAVSGVHFYVYSVSAQATDRLRVTLQFWNAHTATASPVFHDPPRPSQAQIDLEGPFNLAAGTAYSADATFDKPILLDVHQSVGVSLHVAGGPFNGDPVETDQLVPAFDIGAASVVGADLAHYGEIGGTRSDFNFANTDRSDDKPLALVLYGRNERRVECGDWPMYTSRFVEEFDDFEAFDSAWTVFGNGGNPVFADGAHTLGNTQGSPTFPYVHSAASTTPIPPTGEFSVRWLARYLTAAPNGTGSLVIAHGAPDNGTSTEDPASRAAWVWQDTTSGFSAFARTGTTGPSPAFSEAAGADAVTHDVEYCWLDDSVELWVDGTRVLQQARSPDVPRPDSLWYGNHVTALPDAQWNSLRLYRVRVHQPGSDPIFADGFEGTGD